MKTLAYTYTAPLNKIGPKIGICDRTGISWILNVFEKGTLEFPLKINLAKNKPNPGAILFKGAYITTYLGIVILILSVIFLNKTKAGLRLRACGENPQAADAAAKRYGCQLPKIKIARAKNP